MSDEEDEEDGGREEGEEDGESEGGGSGSEDGESEGGGSGSEDGKSDDAEWRANEIRRVNIYMDYMEEQRAAPDDSEPDYASDDETDGSDEDVPDDGKDPLVQAQKALTASEKKERGAAARLGDALEVEGGGGAGGPATLIEATAALQAARRETDAARKALREACAELKIAEDEKVSADRSERHGRREALRAASKNIERLTEELNSTKRMEEDARIEQKDAQTRETKERQARDRAARARKALEIATKRAAAAEKRAAADEKRAAAKKEKTEKSAKKAADNDAAKEARHEEAVEHKYTMKEARIANAERRKFVRDRDRAAANEVKDAKKRKAKWTKQLYKTVREGNKKLNEEKRRRKAAEAREAAKAENAEKRKSEKEDREKKRADAKEYIRRERVRRGFTVAKKRADAVRLAGERQKSRAENAVEAAAEAVRDVEERLERANDAAIKTLWELNDERKAVEEPTVKVSRGRARVSYLSQKEAARRIRRREQALQRASAQRQAIEKRKVKVEKVLEKRRRAVAAFDLGTGMEIVDHEEEDVLCKMGVPIYVYDEDVIMEDEEQEAARKAREREEAAKKRATDPVTDSDDSRSDTGSDPMYVPADPFSTALEFFRFIYPAALSNLDYYGSEELEGLLHLKRDYALTIAGSCFAAWVPSIGAVLTEYVPRYGMFFSDKPDDGEEDDDGVSRSRYRPRRERGNLDIYKIQEAWKQESSGGGALFTSNQISIAIAYHALCLNGDVTLRALLGYTVRSLAILAWKIFFWGAPEHETSPAGKYFPFLHVCHCHVDADEEARFDPTTPISKRGHASDREPGLEIYDTGFMRLRRRNEMLADIALPKELYCFSYVEAPWHDDDESIASLVPRPFLFRMLSPAHRVSLRPLTLDDEVDAEMEKIMLPEVEQWEETVYRRYVPRPRVGPDDGVLVSRRQLMSLAASEWFALRSKGDVPLAYPMHGFPDYTHVTIQDVLRERDAAELVGCADVDVKWCPYWHIAAGLFLGLRKTAVVEEDRARDRVDVSIERVAFALSNALGNLARATMSTVDVLPRILPHPYPIPALAGAASPRKIVVDPSRSPLAKGASVRVNADATYAPLGVFSRCAGFSVPLNDPGTGGTSGVPARGTTASRAFSSIYDAYHWTETCAELRSESPVRRMFRVLRPFFRENQAAWELLGSLGAYELLFVVPPLDAPRDDGKKQGSRIGARTGDKTGKSWKWPNSNALGRIYGVILRPPATQRLLDEALDRIDDIYDAGVWEVDPSDLSVARADDVGGDILMRAIVATARLYGATLAPLNTSWVPPDASGDAPRVDYFFRFLSRRVAAPYTAFMLTGEVMWVIRVGGVDRKDPRWAKHTRRIHVSCPLTSTSYEEIAPYTFSRALFAALGARALLSDPLFDGQYLNDTRPVSDILTRVLRSMWAGVRPINPAWLTNALDVMPRAAPEILASGAPSEWHRYFCLSYREIAGFDPQLPIATFDASPDMHVFRRRVRNHMAPLNVTRSRVMRLVTGVSAVMRVLATGPRSTTGDDDDTVVGYDEDEGRPPHVFDRIPDIDEDLRELADVPNQPAYMDAGPCAALEAHFGAGARSVAGPDPPLAHVLLGKDVARRAVLDEGRGFICIIPRFAATGAIPHFIDAFCVAAMRLITSTGTYLLEDVYALWVMYTTGAMEGEGGPSPPELGLLVGSMTLGCTLSVTTPGLTVLTGDGDKTLTAAHGRYTLTASFATEYHIIASEGRTPKELRASSGRAGTARDDWRMPFVEQVVPESHVSAVRTMLWLENSRSWAGAFLSLRGSDLPTPLPFGLIKSVSIETPRTRRADTPLQLLLAAPEKMKQYSWMMTLSAESVATLGLAVYPMVPVRAIVFPFYLKDWTHAVSCDAVWSTLCSALLVRDDGTTRKLTLAELVARFLFEVSLCITVFETVKEEDSDGEEVTRMVPLRRELALKSTSHTRDGTPRATVLGFPAGFPFHAPSLDSARQDMRALRRGVRAWIRENIATRDVMGCLPLNVWGAIREHKLIAGCRRPDGGIIAQGSLTVARFRQELVGCTGRPILIEGRPMRENVLRVSLEECRITVPLTSKTVTVSMHNERLRASVHLKWRISTDRITSSSVTLTRQNGDKKGDTVVAEVHWVQPCQCDEAFVRGHECGESPPAIDMTVPFASYTVTEDDVSLLGTRVW